jgi:hypothetical protein
MKHLATLALLLFIVCCADGQFRHPVNRCDSRFYGQAGEPNVKVWVNSRTHIYHCQGARWFGKTRRGYFTTQENAQRAEARPASRQLCPYDKRFGLLLDQ